MSQSFDSIHVHHTGCVAVSQSGTKSDKHSLLQIPTIYEVVHQGGGSGSGGGEWPEWLRNVHDVSHSLIVFNSAVNFLLYTFL